MPSGKQHIKINVFVFWTLIIAALLLGVTRAVYYINLTTSHNVDPLNRAVMYLIISKIYINRFFFFGILIGTYLITPDWDLDRSVPDQNWGILEKVLNFYSATHKHRGFSHFPILGSIEKLIYVCGFFYLVLWLISFEIDQINPEILNSLFVSVWENIFFYKFNFVWNGNFMKFVLGVIFGELLHLISDTCKDLSHFFKKKETAEIEQTWGEYNGTI